jgi:hypothetical protein
MTEGKPHKVGYRMRRVGVNDPVLVNGSIGRAESKSLLLADIDFNTENVCSRCKAVIPSSRGS